MYLLTCGCKYQEVYYIHTMKKRINPSRQPPKPMVTDDADRERNAAKKKPSPTMACCCV
jgi:hypothetical protein